jgi:hypothetical protein
MAVDPETALLRAFVTAVRAGSISRAARATLCDPSYFREPPRWTVRVPLIWAAGPAALLPVNAGPGFTATGLLKRLV